MRAHLLFFVVAAFDADGAPTFDPEDTEFALMDEYMTDDARPEPRFLQALLNGTNETFIPPPPPEEHSLPLIPLAIAGAGAVAVVGFCLMKPDYTYETHDYDHAADSGLLDHPDYDVHEVDESDYD
jgi:hypothetical protein